MDSSYNKAVFTHFQAQEKRRVGRPPKPPEEKYVGFYCKLDPAFNALLKDKIAKTDKSEGEYITDALSFAWANGWRP